MRGFLLVPSILGVMALAFWAYQENYRTQTAQSDAARIIGEIGDLRARLALLEAEWAYLNRPSRLAVLAELNFERLSLQPFAPSQFAQARQVPFPPDPTELLVDGIVEARGDLLGTADAEMMLP